MHDIYLPITNAKKYESQNQFILVNYVLFYPESLENSGELPKLIYSGMSIFSALFYS
jgi:hypothetical protein